MIRTNLSASGVTLLFGALLSVIAAASVRAEDPVEKPAQVTQVRGVDLGDKQPMVYVARDKATWDKIKQAAGERHEFPRARSRARQSKSRRSTIWTAPTFSRT